MTEREALRAEALEVLRREVPEELEWVPWVELPPIRWRDGTAVDERVPRGWLVAAAQRGQPEAGDEQRRQAGLFDRGDATALGAWLLRAWIEHDTAEPELGAARRAELRAIAERAAELAERFGRGGSDPEERYRQLLAQEDNRPAPSALPYQGLLAAVAACAGGGVAGDVERYLAAWHEERPAQCRALLRMLSSVEDPAAAEVVAAYAGRFR